MIADILIRLGRCPVWSESLLGTQASFLVCHVATQFEIIYSESVLLKTILWPLISTAFSRGFRRWVTTCFHADLRKIIPNYHHTLHLIWNSVNLILRETCKRLYSSSYNFGEPTWPGCSKQAMLAYQNQIH